MKPRVRADRTRRPWAAAWMVVVDDRRITTGLTWPAAIDLALRLAA
jgi:hypothetical protein